MAGRKKGRKQVAPLWGGRRPGAGRPPTVATLRFSVSEAQAVRAVCLEGEDLHEACKRLVLEGATEQETAPAGREVCISCGQRFDPWHKRRWCNVCHNPLP